MNLQPDRPLLVMTLWWPVHMSRQETGLYLRLPFPPLLLLCSRAEPFSSPVNFSIPIMLGLLVGTQRGTNPGCARFFPSHGFPLPPSVPLRPPGNSPKENSKIVKMMLTKYGLNEKSGRVVWFGTANWEMKRQGQDVVAVFKILKACSRRLVCKLPGLCFRSATGERQWLKCNKILDKVSHV